LTAIVAKFVVVNYSAVHLQLGQ